MTQILFETPVSCPNFQLFIYPIEVDYYILNRNIGYLYIIICLNMSKKTRTRYSQGFFFLIFVLLQN